jgi:hypothetical protein
MPDLELLPPGHALRAAPRPPAGLGEVLARATRRRRRQRTGALATGAAACAAVLAFSMTTSGAVDSLGVTPAHQGEGGVPVVSAPTPATTAAQTDQNALSVGGDAHPNIAARSGEVGTRSGAAQGHDLPAAAAAQQTKPDGEVGPPHTISSYDASRGCTGAGPLATDGWCGYYDGAVTGHAGQRVELAETLCRLPGRGAGALLSDTGQQAEFSATSKEAYTVWRWSTGHRFSKRGTSITVPEGSCVRWHVSWKVVDNAGRPLPPGPYDLGAKPHVYPSQSTGPAHVYADANFITFTVT